MLHLRQERGRQGSGRSWSPAVGLQRGPPHWIGPTSAPASVGGQSMPRLKPQMERGWRRNSPEESHMELSSIVCAMAFPSTSLCSFVSSQHPGLVTARGNSRDSSCHISCHGKAAQSVCLGLWGQCSSLLAFYETTLQGLKDKKY